MNAARFYEQLMRREEGISLAERCARGEATQAAQDRAARIAEKGYDYAATKPVPRPARIIRNPWKHPFHLLLMARERAIRLAQAMPLQLCAPSSL